MYEVQEAADIVATASDQEVNMIFGSVINENLKDEIVVTVIATGFNEEGSQPKVTRPSFGQAKPTTGTVKREHKREEELRKNQSGIQMYHKRRRWIFQPSYVTEIEEDNINNS